MKWIGLTGGIASGKSTVAKFFEEFNIPVIGADQVSHNLTRKNQEAFKEIVRSFGNHILS
ncbi:MAG: dephospho-CoA kinase, partial [Bdellovibrionales bacterium]|nr:dephospho-CoA kinase [Bdellovibrionales bacterium]